jgi:hypothetical protein
MRFQNIKPKKEIKLYFYGKLLKFKPIKLAAIITLSKLNPKISQ